MTTTATLPLESRMSTAHLKPAPTPEQMAQALAAMRKRKAFARWPESLEDACADPWRERLIAVNAWATGQRVRQVLAARTSARLRATAELLLQQTAQHPLVHLTDCKRAASGERDD